MLEVVSVSLTLFCINSFPASLIPSNVFCFADEKPGQKMIKKLTQCYSVLSDQGWV